MANTPTGNRRPRGRSTAEEYRESGGVEADSVLVSKLGHIHRLGPNLKAGAKVGERQPEGVGDLLGIAGAALDLGDLPGEREIRIRQRFRGFAFQEFLTAQDFLGLLVFRSVTESGYHRGLPGVDQLLAHAVGHLANIESRTGVIHDLAHHQLRRLVLGGLQDAGFRKRFQHST